MLGEDRNITYFHHHASNLKRVNSIKRLSDNNGGFITLQKDISKAAVSYFSELNHSEHDNAPLDEIFTDVQFPALSCIDREVLSKPFTMEEIQCALGSMHPTKAPGPDGYQVKFFHTEWDIVGQSISSLLLDCLNNGKSIQGLNAVYITLISKIKNPENKGDFRPISLCNVVYKIFFFLKS